MILDPTPSEMPVDRSKRSFLGALLGLSTAFVTGLLSLPVLRYALYPLTAKAKSTVWSAAGPVAEATAATEPLRRTLDFKQKDGWLEVDASPLVYLVKKGDQVKALSAICPHLGCVVPWVAARNEFVCPCHGGTFSPDGERRSGPPRRGMDVLETKIADGQVMVKYQTFRADVPNKLVTS